MAILDTEGRDASSKSEDADAEQNDDKTTDDEGRPDGQEFTKVMAISTRKSHRLTDMLVNAKLGIAMSDNRVWAEGLLIFYDIFRFLEGALDRLQSKLEVFNRMSKVIKGIQRTKAFEEDLKYHYGDNFLVTYEIRPSVGTYLRHLQVLEEREPLRLLSYIYHLYLGLLSGGQVLTRKRDLQRKLLTVGGLIENTIPDSRKKMDAVTRFEDGRSIPEIKKEIKFTMNDIAADLSTDERNSLLEEGTLVFRYNLEIIQSIKGTGRIAIFTLLTHPIFILCLILLSATIFWLISN